MRKGGAVSEINYACFFIAILRRIRCRVIIMKIGYVTHYDRTTAATAKRLGFDCIEAFIEPNSPMDITKMSSEAYNAIMNDMESHNIIFGSLSTGINHLCANEDERKFNNDYFKSAIKRCRDFGTEVLMVNPGGNRNISVRDNLAVYKKVFSEYAEAAEKYGVKIAMENCPHQGGYPLTIGNIGYSPEAFDEMMRLVSSESIGLEFDPSHFTWQFIDYLALLRVYKNRIYGFHAKDTEIDEKRLGRYGIYGNMVEDSGEHFCGYWRFRLPGYGQVKWREIFKILQENFYKGTITIEHEDPVFSGIAVVDGKNVNLTEVGLSIGLKYLRQFDILF